MPPLLARPALGAVLYTVATAFATLGSAPDPSPSASPSPTPLTEIGRVRTTVCSAIVEHANVAIDAAVADDADLNALVAVMVNPGLDDGNELKKRNLLRALEQAASKLRLKANDGEGEIRKLRAQAAKSPEPRKSELLAFANALGGALYRQRMMAIETQRLLVMQEGRDAQADAGAQAPSIAATGYGHGPAAQTVNDAPLGSSPPSLDRALRAAAEDFTNRLPLIKADEGTAADHSAGATSGC